ncbi:MAG: methylenetetrahydrofolate reductase [NAD(P)H] [Lachnospiraceae bacterium]|nr:methylenetetrahydrofolate reductase [NAD(P)H] [Lachnospiraceae bacterium]
MKITDSIRSRQVTISFEVFPPKTTEKYESVYEAAKKIAALSPSYISVTYGAGGGRSRFTSALAGQLQRETGIPVLAHLSCVTSTRTTVRETIAAYREEGIANILALRGDIPEDGQVESDYRYASELVAELHKEGGFCIGGACYPEGHIECAHKADDIRHLKEKVDAGCEFLTTQMFFDNNIFYNFLYRVRDIGIEVPVIPGIMPVTTARQLSRSVAMSGTNVPERFRAIVDRFGDDAQSMKQAGIVYASEQIVDLIANNVRHIHVYSMNKPDVAEGILRNLSGILGRTYDPC